MPTLIIDADACPVTREALACARSARIPVDVYKRQGRWNRASTACSGCTPTAPGTSCGRTTPTRGSMPVSYTHLDVYKRQLPDCADTPLVADVSSCFLSGPLDIERYGMLFAGAQKNAGSGQPSI